MNHAVRGQALCDRFATQGTISNRRVRRIKPLFSFFHKSTHELHMLRTGTMGAAVDALLSKVKRTLDSVHGLRIFAVMNGKWLRDYKLSDPISTAHDMLSMYVEEIPKEELDLGENEFLLQCFHFQSDVNRTHGIPFKIVVKDVRGNARSTRIRREWCVSLFFFVSLMGE